MGTQEERDWVDVANDLLSKCHINLRLRKVTDCDASVFVALYEAILGEKVPDYIAAPRSQEDDIHNVQSVIDSLALDYLQISLSHITGENVARGDKESVKNLLEIFDGLLEYLTEQIYEEEPRHEGRAAAEEPDGVPGLGGTDAAAPGTDRPERQEKGDLLERVSQCSSMQSTVRSSSKHSLPSWSADGSESTAELIRLGDSARTFTAKHRVCRSASDQSDGAVSAERRSCEAHRTGPSGSRPGHSREPAVDPAPVPRDRPNASATLLREPLHSAIPLLPPYQTTPQRPERRPPSGSQSPASVSSHRGEEEEQRPPGIRVNGQSPRPPSDAAPANGLQSPCRFLDEGERSVTNQRAVSSEVDRKQMEPSGGGPRRVLFRTEPDVLFLTLRNRSGEESQDGTASPQAQKQDHRGHRDRGGPRGGGALEEGRASEPLSWHRQRNRQTEQELHQMSEKLTRRLEELDAMLKRALGEGGETADTKEEDKHSHHSDSVMECRRTRRQTGTPHTSRSPRTRSLSPSPPPARRSLQAQLDEALSRNVQPHMSRVHREEQRELQSQRRLGQVVSRAYEDELKRLEDRERADMARERGRVQGTEREYREAVQNGVPRVPDPSQVFSPKALNQHRPPRARQLTPGRGRQHPRKPALMKVKENDLLPLLLEEFPHLQLSPHTLTRMWKKQLKQVDHLAAVGNHHARNKLTSQVEEAQRRHDLLVEIIRKEQEHNHRLRDFKDRIQQQKSAQNKLKEQRRQIARAKKYHSDYHVQMRARMMRARTREERMFKQIFEEGLELQKSRLREERAYAKEVRQEHQRKHRDELESMENYYKDQFSLLAETLAQERREIQMRKKAQEKALQKMKRELRSKMEREIGELQKIIIQNDDDDYFWDLEAERLRGKVKMASFQYSAGHVP
ncbi:centrosomal protein of 95 kDa-like isoform X1 [Anguilla anguilla]|uniref:centrosomal protein of 95 kDa-like isoform X1 n=1 Tax=Anguilla anguilla TaxID=7936 RepID=UPI0015A8AFEE|nr:centrosomal protein of 95 kDa-like isoform X1 [Anguilla anguilla]